MNSIDIDVIRTALDWQSRGHRVVMGTVVRTWGSAPRPPGSLMIIWATARWLGRSQAVASKTT